ncbi:response regulator plnd [Companilactobacillus mindensis DSM 14500]|uniref:Response regulator plnd n=1 Tax=Companilactobacillus mindensis DSM 14500 TaxID=1423770 RepID=A0A0R1QU81_9LACO|nr:LytTR family transcriptional regulator DNA-binding domain-containing protein [Companilactobacillus mindensis]KRL44859.1 response regulator plnd [Companilactobacillus mindensis DSM 14500]GEO79730.1 DNA-binding response regulator [Companilactobacillus mindensis]
MFSIYLLEDNDKQRAYYREIIDNTVMINDYSIDVIESNNMESFYNSFSKDQFGLFFLDMEIDGDIKAGIKIAEFVRNSIPDARIVFVTTHEELAFLTLERKISPLDYVLKDKSSKDIKEKIINDIELTEKYYQSSIFKKELTFGYKVGSKYFSIPMKELVLLYTEKNSPGRVNLESDNRKVSFPSNLNLIEAKYSNLLRVDKSSLANVDRVVSYDSRKRILYLDNGIQCGVSIRKSSVVSKIFK